MTAQGRSPRRPGRSGFPRVTFFLGVGALVAVLVLSGSGSWLGVTPSLSAATEAPRTPVPASPSAAAAEVSTVTSAPATLRPAVSAPTWVNVSRNGSGVAPPTGYAESVTYDPMANLTVLFGGCLADQCPSNQTWAFSNGSWTNITPLTGSPPARDYASMDFDPNMGGVLLFGGAGAGGVPRNDTWLFRGGFWTNVSYVGGGPAPRLGAAMAFDPAPEENGSVLYGGCVDVSLSYNCFNDTWVWQGWSGWVPLTPSLTGPEVGFAGMAYDPADGYLVLFGGCSGVFCFGISDQTWEFYAGQWWEVQPAVAPSALTDASLAYDPVGKRLILFGGINNSLELTAETWSFAGGAWANLAPAASPSARSDYGLALDATGTTLVLVGGITNSSEANDTWAFEVPASVSLVPSTTAYETSQAVTFTATAGGGTGPYNLLLEFGDGTGVQLSGPGPTFTTTHAYPEPGTYVASVTLTDAVGAGAKASTASIHVSAGPAIVASVEPGVGEVGVPVAFAVNVTSGGAPPLTYAWHFGDTSSGTGATPTHAYAAPGVYPVTVTATDALGGTANSSVTVTIEAVPAVTISYLPSEPNVASLVRFLANVTGGVGPFQFTWRFGNGNSSVEPSPALEFAGAGKYTVTLYVNDSLGGSTHTSMTVTVASRPAPSSSGGGLTGAPIWFWGGLAGLVVVGAAGTVLLWRRPGRGTG
jgi:PKD repeat protein